MASVTLLLQTVALEQSCQEPPAQQSPPPPRTSVPGGEHCQVWGSPGRGLQGGPATPTQAGLGKDVKAWVRQRQFVHRHSSASVR